jgi:hypothetical protein
LLRNAIDVFFDSRGALPIMKLLCLVKVVAHFLQAVLILGLGP